jgi:hypothetical protein
MAGIGALPPFTGTSAKDPLPPTRDARLGDRNGRFGIMTARALLLGGVPHPNVLGSHPQDLRQRHPRIGAVPRQGLDQLVWPGRR